MKFEFENFGYIDNGSIELSELTLICGQNNRGKTYVSYGIYGFLKHFKEFVDLSFSSEKVEKLKKDGSISLDLKSYLNKIDKCLKDASDKFGDSLASYFNAPDDFFSGSKIKFSWQEYSLKLDNEFKQQIEFGSNESLIFDKAPKESILFIAFKTVGESKLANRILSNIINDTIAACLFSSFFPKPFVVTSERTGISLFYKELDISKNALIEQIAKGDKIDALSILNSRRSRYAQPIHDNIAIVRDYENLSKRKSFLRNNKPVIDSLQDIIGGSFKSVDKQVIYQPKKERGRNKIAVPVYIASSSIKSLFLIDFYINCLAQEQGILIIDEPELNLHPDNQRKMASLLARLVNAGIKVIITTHSDYLIREINNFIMLSNAFENKESIMKKALLTKHDILRPEQVKAYNLTENHKINSISVDKFGINTELFDNTISIANSLSDEIYFELED